MRTFNLNIKFITHFLLILDDEYNDWQSSTGRSHHFNKLMISSQRLLTNLQMINIGNTINLPNSKLVKHYAKNT
jgi:hypothetical protein